MRSASRFFHFSLPEIIVISIAWLILLFKRIFLCCCCFFSSWAYKNCVFCFLQLFLIFLSSKNLFSSFASRADYYIELMRTLKRIQSDYDSWASHFRWWLFMDLSLIVSDEYFLIVTARKIKYNNIWSGGPNGSVITFYFILWRHRITNVQQCVFSKDLGPHNHMNILLCLMYSH